MIEDHQIRTLMLLYELEKSLSGMYEVFSHEYPAHNNLWNRLISEEQKHAEAVRKLYGLTYQGKVLFEEGTIKNAGVQSIIDYIKNVSDSARNRKYTDRQAISLSLDIEKSLIEKKLFDHFKVSSELADVLSTLQEGSEGHASLVEKE
jgi:rubrerythrin